MLKKVITYTDYDGNERTETHYFNLSKAELLDMEMFTVGGYTSMLERVIEERDQVELVKLFREIVLKSYGIKSDDGKRFMKSEEITRAFTETEAFTELYMELATNSEAAAAFVNGIMPKDIQQQIKEEFPDGAVDIKDLAKAKLGKE